MHLESLYLHHFRNYEKAELTLSPETNVILGDNAQGKTNLLEAIYFLSMGRSFRTRHLNELVASGQGSFYLEATFIKEGIPQKIQASFDGKVRKIQYNNTSFTHLLGLLPTVIYAPGDAALISGAPAERRHFLDLHIAQIDPLYVHHVSRYLKALKQRNILLRQKSEAGIDAWEESMALSGSYVMAKRREALVELAIPLKEEMHGLSEGMDLLTINYHPSLSSPHLAEEWRRQRKREMHLGATLVGPHLDELQISINEKSAKLFASEGQKRSALAALRFAEWRRLKTMTGTAPLFSIDDFGIHLDEKRHALLANKLEGMGQVFLTSPYPLDSFSPSLRKARLISVKQGQAIN